MKTPVLPLFFWLLLLCVIPQWAVAEEREDDADFIRVVTNERRVLLQTGVARYVKNGVVVDLIGAIHIADASYYKELNELFLQYDSLLFEMVGGGHIKKHSELAAVAEAAAKTVPLAESATETVSPRPRKPQRKAKDPMLRVLGGAYKMMSQFLELKGQREAIDYTAENFVHADLSLVEFEALQKKKKESLLGFAFQNALHSKKQGLKDRTKKVDKPDGRKMLIGLLRGDSDMLKREMMVSMGSADDQVAAFAGDSVIIGDRNEKCLKVLARQIEDGDQKLGVFYGAAHLPDMEKRMLKAGFRKKSHRWMTAWEVGRGNGD